MSHPGSYPYAWSRMETLLSSGGGNLKFRPSIERPKLKGPCRRLRLCKRPCRRLRLCRYAHRIFWTKSCARRVVCSLGRYIRGKTYRAVGHSNLCCYMLQLFVLRVPAHMHVAKLSSRPRPEISGMVVRKEPADNRDPITTVSTPSARLKAAPNIT